MNQRLKLLIDLVQYRLKLIGKQAVLLDTPEHDNLGDQAIAAAEKQFLKCSGVSFIELPAERLEGREKWFARVTPKEKTILIQGGGFLGDFWKNEEYRVRRILQHFNKNKIVVFPQSAYFRNHDEFFEKSRHIYNNHPNLTIFARETKTYDLLREYFENVHSYYVPDMVLGLQTRLKPTARDGILFCLRNDEERKTESWLLSQLTCYISEHVNTSIRNTDTLCGHPVNSKTRELEVKKKLEEFSCAKLVITDRLHGMLFAAITGTPCIAFQNISGKVDGVYQWIKHLNYVFSVDSMEAFEEAFQKLDLYKEYSFDIESFDAEFEPIRMVICQK